MSKCPACWMDPTDHEYEACPEWLVPCIEHDDCQGIQQYGNVLLHIRGEYATPVPSDGGAYYDGGAHYDDGQEK